MHSLEVSVGFLLLCQLSIALDGITSVPESETTMQNRPTVRPARTRAMGRPRLRPDIRPTSSSGHGDQGSDGGQFRQGGTNRFGGDLVNGGSLPEGLQLRPAFPLGKRMRDEFVPSPGLPIRRLERVLDHVADRPHLGGEWFKGPARDRQGRGNPRKKRPVEFRMNKKGAHIKAMVHNKMNAVDDSDNVQCMFKKLQIMNGMIEKFGQNLDDLDFDMMSESESWLNGKFKGVSASGTTMAKRFQRKNNLTLEISAYQISEAGQITNHDETTDVEPGDIEFGISMENLNCDREMGDTIHLKMHCGGRRGKVPKQLDMKPRSQGKPLRIDMGRNAELKLSLQHKCNQTWLQLSKSDITLAEGEFTVKFPCCEDVLTYDPTIDAGDDLDADEEEEEEGNHASVVTASVIGLLGFVAMTIVV